MKAKSFKRVLSVLMLLILCLSLAPAAFADLPASGDDEGTITKYIVMGKDDVLPCGITYPYVFTPGTPEPTHDPEIYAGVAGGVTNVSLVFGTESSPEEYVTGIPGDSSVTAKKTAVNSVTVPITVSKFTAPGIYRYTVTESRNPSAAISGYTDGTPNTRIFDVYVGYDTDNSTLKVLGTLLYKQDGGTLTKSDGFDAEYTTKGLSISKTVSGAMGDHSEYFDFSVTIDRDDNAASTVTITPTDASNTSPTSIAEGTATTIHLKHGQTATITGLPASAEYTISETAVTGYTTSVVATGSTVNGATVTGNMADSRTVAYTNTNSFTVPAGLSLDMAPFVAVVLLAALGLTLPLLKKKKAQR